MPVVERPFLATGVAPDGELSEGHHVVYLFRLEGRKKGISPEGFPLLLRATGLSSLLQQYKSERKPHLTLRNTGTIAAGATVPGATAPAERQAVIFAVNEMLRL